MKKGLLASVAVSTLVFTYSSYAAELPAKPILKARPVPVPVFSWTGCYIGAHGGWGRGRESTTQHSINSSGIVTRTNPGDIDTQGAIFGGQVGCNYQFSGNWVAGIQGDIAGTDIKGKGPDPMIAFFGTGTRPGVISVETDWLASATLRLGYALHNNQALLYVKGGGAWTQNQWDLSLATLFYAPNRISESRTGWTLGVGGEWMFTQNWSGFVEYNHYDFGDGGVLVTTLTSSFRTNQFITGKQTIDTVKVGVNYKLGWGAPVVAKY